MNELAMGFAALAMAVTAHGPGEAPYYRERMVCPENGPFAFSHGSTLVELPDGSLYCAWYAGSREKGDDVAIVGSTLAEGAGAWSEPFVIIDTPNKSEGNPVLFVDTDGILWLFYQTMYGSGEGPTRQGTGWTTCKIKAITSTDSGETWSDERTLTEELGYLTRCKPIVLKDDSILLPIHDERDWSSGVLISTDAGATWEMSQRIDCGLGFHLGNIEPTLLEREDGSVLCYMRNGSEVRRVWESVSQDGGRTWSKPVQIAVPNPDSALDLVRLNSGNVVLALNPVPADRRKLSLWLSKDDATSWHVFRDLERCPPDNYASYPAVIQGRNGLIHVTYSRRNGGIKHATVNEAWVWAGALLGGEDEHDTSGPMASAK